MKHIHIIMLALASLGLTLGAAAQAQQAPDQPAEASAAAGAGEGEHDTLLGDMGGLRPSLERAGLSLGLQETSEYSREVSGGLRRGGVYRGVTQLTLEGDGEKALGWSGGSFFLSALQIHGRRASFTGDYVGGLQTVSNIEAEPGSRLWELWGQQSWADGKFDLRFGKLAADQEFMTSEYGAALTNAMFGWAALPSLDLPAGGPAYPLSSLGLRLRAKASDRVTLLAGVFDGSPLASGDAPLNWADRHGMRFSPVGKALLIAELQYQRPADAPGSLPGTYKVGVWAHTGRFADLAGDDTVRQHRGNSSVYAMLDQMVWRQGARSVGVFARAMAAPGDRNWVDFSANAGLSVQGPFEGRAADVLALGMGYAHISRRARDLGPGVLPLRNSEAFVEATYRYQIKPWWQLQADLQYMLRPGAGVPDPQNLSHRVPNAFMVGVRTTIAF